MRLEIKEITLGYQPRHTEPRMLVERLTLAAPEGELIALLGRNGVGKSTLLRVLAGVQAPLKGHILLDHLDVATMTAHQRARQIAFVTTEAIAVAHLRVHEVVAMGRAPYTGWFGTLSPDDERIVADALERVGMTPFRDKMLESLSDGERQRIMIARALAQDTPVMLLDEPTAFLDLPNRYQIALLLRELAHDIGKTILFSSHDLSTAVQLCDALWVMTPGGISAGAPEDLMRSGALNAMFGDAPLTLTAEGVVKLDTKATYGLQFTGETDTETAILLGKLARRCGFLPIFSENPGDTNHINHTNHANAIAELKILTGNTGFEITSPFPIEGGGYAADFHSLATLLRRLRPPR